MHQYSLLANDISLLISGPFPETDYDEEIPSSVDKFYRLKFWSVAEMEDDLVLGISYHSSDNRLFSIRHEKPEFEDLLDNVMTCYDEECAGDFNEIELQYYRKLSDLVNHAEKCIMSNRVPVGEMISWSDIEKE